MVVPTGLLYIDDTDVATLGLAIARPVRGPWDGIDLRQSAAPVLGKLGRIALTDAPVANPRQIVAMGRQVASSTAALQVLEDALKRLVYDGVVRVCVGDRPTREWEAKARMRVTPIGGWQTRIAQDVELVFDCDDPTGQDTTDSVVSFSAGAAECPLGTAPSAPIIRIGGGVTDPEVTLKDHLGQVVATMAFTIVLGAGEWLEIDCESQTIIDQDGANQAATFDGSGEFLVLNPYHAAGPDGPWPTLSTSGGTLAVAEYRRRWL